MELQNRRTPLNKNTVDEMLRLSGNVKIGLFDVSGFHTTLFVPSANLKADTCAFPYRLHLFDLEYAD
jgi:hypothetical protein